MDENTYKMIIKNLQSTNNKLSKRLEKSYLGEEQYSLLQEQRKEIFALESKLHTYKMSFITLSVLVGLFVLFTVIS